jgi:hypothetical protein
MSMIFLDLLMQRNLLVQPGDGGCLVVAVVEQARQQGRKGSQHLAKQRRGNVPLNPWPITADTVSVAD